MILILLILLLILYINIELFIRPYLGNYPKYKDYKVYEKHCNNIVWGSFVNKKDVDNRKNKYTQTKHYTHLLKPIGSLKEYMQEPKFDKDDFEFCLLPHATLYFYINKHHILIDPHLLYNIKLPPIDIILITHNHKDHLDKKRLLSCGKDVQRYFVPLGLKKLLVSWEIDESKIIEMAWQDTNNYHDIEITCLPARHYSNRNVLDSNRTLWCSYALVYNKTSIYYSGDTGFGNHFEEIHKQFDHFDYVFVECNIYKKRQANMHLYPEHSYHVAEILKASYCIPVVTYEANSFLVKHQKSIERFLKKARMSEIHVLLPQLGEVCTKKNVSKMWWKKEYK